MIYGNRITGLALHEEELVEFPESITNLNGLKELYLQANNISKIPENIEKLKNLEILYLSYNEIKELPETIGNLSKLRKLYLNNNQLEAIPKTLGNLKKLEVLDLFPLRRYQTLWDEIQKKGADGRTERKKLMDSQYRNKLYHKFTIIEEIFFFSKRV